MELCSQLWESRAERGSGQTPGRLRLPREDALWPRRLSQRVSKRCSRAVFFLTRCEPTAVAKQASRRGRTSCGRPATSGSCKSMPARCSVTSVVPAHRGLCALAVRSRRSVTRRLAQKRQRRCGGPVRGLSAAESGSGLRGVRPEGYGLTSQKKTMWRSCSRIVRRPVRVRSPGCRTGRLRPNFAEEDDVEVLFEVCPPPCAGQVSKVSDRRVTA